MTTTSSTPASFLSDPPVDEAVEKLYDEDRDGMGYVMNLTRVWAHCPDALELLSSAMVLALNLSGLDDEERALLVLATASTMGDAYCSLSYGSKLARAVGDEIAVGVVRGDGARLTPRWRLLAAWARQIVRDPNGSNAEQVDELRAAGFDDRQIFGLTFFVTLRTTLSTVNAALGAAPDAALAAAAPPALAEAINFGRAPARAPEERA
jgi:uncharacterized peroxidase-related enzyme